MPPKKGKGQADQGKPEGNGQKKKKKILPKGEGMGGTIGYTDKEEKNRCILPSVRSYVKKDACCPMEMGCTMPSMTQNNCCPPQQPGGPGSTNCCYIP